VYAPTPKDRQRQAVQFLLSNLQTPPELTNPAVWNRIGSSGSLSYDKFVQIYVLYSLFQPSRLNRMLENEVMHGPKAYSQSDFLADVTSGVWPEIYSSTRGSSYSRREAQRSYLDILDFYINGAPARSEFRLLAEMQLKELASKLDKAAAQATTPLERMYYADSRKYVERIIDGKTAYAFHSVAAQYQAFLGFDGGLGIQGKNKPLSCFDSPVKAMFEDWRRNPAAFEKKYGLPSLGN
jgi:hypothetical protein